MKALRWSNSISIWVQVLSVVLLLTGCVRPIEHHGYFDKQNKLETLKLNESSRQDVLAALGTPSFEGAFNSSNWYYLGQSFKINILFRPEEINREIISIHFDDADTVSEIQTYSLANGIDIDPELAVTPVVDKDLSAVEQILSNLGRVGAGGSSP